MDKRALLGFLLIGVLLITWMTYNSSVSTRPVAQKQDSTQQATQQQSSQQTPPSTLNPDQYGEVFQPAVSGSEQLVTVETDLVRAVISSKGGVIKRWQLKKFESWRGEPVQLLSYDNPLGEMGVFFSSQDGKAIDTRRLYFTLSSNGNPVPSTVQLSGADSLVLTARLALENGATMTKTYTLHGNKYSAGFAVKMDQFESLIANRRYEIRWTGGLKYQEKNSVDESSFAEAMASTGGDLETIDAKTPNEKVEAPGLSGAIDFTAVKTKYFTAAIIPQNLSTDTDVYLEGTSKKTKNEGLAETYSMSYRVPLRPTSPTEQFTLYIGPIDYDIVKQYGLEKTVHLGWPVIRQIGEYLLLPLLKLVHSVIPNYGFAIIVFSLLVKLLLYPLSIQQIRSTTKMKLLAPEMARIREQYKDDMTVQQQQMMRLYSEYGINPVGGCFPLLLQMPILYSLWSVLSSAIDLRHTHFALWITDLSVPDVLIQLPFKLLFIDHISGLALLMGITMFIQQKQTITDPRQKGIVYIMPIMFLFMFSNFPAGLNLYYFMFNLIGILQQLYASNFSKNKLTLEDLKKMPKKEGWLQKRMREVQEMAAAQGRPIPGQPLPPQNGKARGTQKRNKHSK